MILFLLWLSSALKDATASHPQGISVHLLIITQPAVSFSLPREGLWLLLAAFLGPVCKLDLPGGLCTPSTLNHLRTNSCERAGSIQPSPEEMLVCRQGGRGRSSSQILLCSPCWRSSHTQPGESTAGWQMPEKKPANCSSVFSLSRTVSRGITLVLQPDWPEKVSKFWRRPLRHNGTYGKWKGCLEVNPGDLKEIWRATTCSAKVCNLQKGNFCHHGGLPRTLSCIWRGHVREFPS